MEVKEFTNNMISLNISDVDIKKIVFEVKKKHYEKGVQIFNNMFFFLRLFETIDKLSIIVLEEFLDCLSEIMDMIEYYVVEDENENPIESFDTLEEANEYVEENPDEKYSVKKVVM